MKRVKQSETEIIQIRLTKRQVEAINELISSGFYINLSEYIRSVVMNDLIERGLFEVKKNEFK
jgi:Arc/MetJ-type ribon-helix-helix transcriptional regulator